MARSVRIAAACVKGRDSAACSIATVLPQSLMRMALLLRADGA